MTYRRAPQHVFDFNNVLLIPDTFIVPMAYFIAAYLIPAFRQERAGDDLNYIQLARQELDYLVMHNTIIPGKFVPGEDSVINPGP
jgi:Mlc titration factor MtfA (ptsG expression regulator)